MKIMKHTVMAMVLGFIQLIWSHEAILEKATPAIIDWEIAEHFDLIRRAQSTKARVALVWLTPQLAKEVSMYQHSRGRCAGFQALSESESSFILNQEYPFQELEDRIQLDQTYQTLAWNQSPVVYKAAIQAGIDQVKSKNIQDFIVWFSNFPTRFNRGSSANVSQKALRTKIEALLSSTRLKWNIDEITHRSTPQKSIRLTLPGAIRPLEVVVLGGHADSINGFGFFGRAPGADDNASGSGALFEALRILSLGEQPERTIEFYWYAGEESGLLGSNEIATDYKKKNKDVIAVLQLDMTAFPGLGSNRIGNIQDYTSSWLRDYFEQINKLYLNLELVPDRCGYACSDHASWYKQGYPTLMPFEANTKTMNQRIHTAGDVSAVLDFNHASLFAKIAVIFAMDLANSTLREPIR